MQPCPTQPDLVPLPRPSQRPPAPGDRIADRYLLLDLLGEGGMGSVWRARCLKQNLDVAVKLIRSSIDVPTARERLRIEAEAATRLRHPAAVRVLDFGATRSGDPFLVMELLAGQELAAVIRAKKRVDELLSVRLLLPLASALSAAHAQGIVHRDIKPGNIVLVPLPGEDRCQPKLLDFGIAKLLGDGDDEPITDLGFTIGSVGYMAPEQVQGEPDIDAAADVWALSVVLYELITGELPFTAKEPSSYLLSIVADEPVPTTLSGGDPELWAILKRGLSRAREDRWPSMAELGEALARWALARGATEDVSGAALSGWLPPRAALRPIWDLTGELRWF